MPGAGAERLLRSRSRSRSMLEAEAGRLHRSKSRSRSIPGAGAGRLLRSRRWHPLPGLLLQVGLDSPAARGPVYKLRPGEGAQKTPAGLALTVKLGPTEWSP